MTRTMLVGAVVGALLVSCGGADGPIDTAEECNDAGGRVVVNPGPGASCTKDEEKIGDIPSGYEGAICCRTR
jgi:hypothetical protein